MKACGGRITGLLAAALLALAGQALAGSSVSLRQTAEVNGAYVRLGALAEISSEEEGRIATIVVGPAPVQGETRSFTRADVEKRLRAFGISEFNIQGAEKVAVTRCAEEIKPANNKEESAAAPQKDAPAEEAGAIAFSQDKMESCVAAAVVEYILRTNSVPGLKVTARVDRLEYDASLAAKASFMIVENVPAQLLAARGRVGLGLYDTKRNRIGVALASLSLDAKAPAIITRKAVDKGDLLQEDGLFLEMRPYRAGTSVIGSVAEVAGKRATVAIQAMNPVKPKDVERVPLVDKNQTVNVLAKAGSFTVRDTACSLEAGSLGDVISMRNPRSKEVFLARVTGPNRVELASAAIQAKEDAGQ